VIESVKTVGFPVLAVTSTHNADRLGAADWIVSSLRPEEVHKSVPKLKFMI
jgi:hypothetical protein